MPSPVPADFATVQRGSLQVTVDEEGETRVRDRYVISAPVAGRMLRIELEPGDPVSPARPCSPTFNPTDPALLDVRTRAELRRACERRTRRSAGPGGPRAGPAERRLRAAQLQRAQQLSRRRSPRSGELELRQQRRRPRSGALQSADFAVRTAEANLQVARASLLQAPATAAARHQVPLAGRRRRAAADAGERGGVATGTPLLEVGDLVELEIVSDLLSTRRRQGASRGSAVIIEQWGGDHPLAGRVRRVEPSGFTKISALGVEEQRVNTIVDFDAPPDVRKSIGDGYRVELRIVVSDRADVLKVPASSLFRAGTDWAVYRVDGDVVKRQIVEVGQQNGLEAEIVKGLAAGDRIVVYPSDAIRDGVKVRTR